MNVILGGGIAGIGAYAADETAHIFEKEPVAGGLCGGFEIDGFHFDKAVHISFTKDPTVRKIFGAADHFESHPLPYNWYHRCWLRHPAQNNLFPLSAEEKTEAVKSFLSRSDYEDGDNFEAWSKSRYGQYMWEHLFSPYNTKYWQIPLKELGINWIGNRIYQPVLDEILYGSYTDRTPNTYYATDMRYPKRGGYFSFIRPIVEKAEKTGHIHYCKKVVEIDPSSKTVAFADGEKISYERLYSSLPMPEMMQITKGIPQSISDKRDRLAYTGMALVSIGLKKPDMLDKTWFYIYDMDIMAARAYSPSVKSPYNVPDGRSSIQFEIYFNSKDPAPEQAAAIKNCVYALKKTGIAGGEDILFADYRVEKYSNVIFAHGTEAAAEEIAAWLKGQGITPIGRFGEWKYLWSDQSFLSGFEAIRSKMGERPLAV